MYSGHRRNDEDTKLNSGDTVAALVSTLRVFIIASSGL